MLEVEPITLVRILDRLVQRDLIERRKDPDDRRAWRLFLKEAAGPLLVAMQPLGEATRAEALSGLSADDRNRLFQTLTLMKTNLMAAGRAALVEKEAEYG
jgi:DNA-binding MarR family transcriptional regulator